MSRAQVRVCIWCGKDFFRSHGQKYCTSGCHREVRAQAQREKKKAMMLSGIIHGRTIKEHKYWVYQTSARDKMIPFKLSYEEFIALWQLPCKYCKDSIEYIGIDRIDSSIGYTTSNITPCCTTCNLMKRAMTKENYIAHCKKVAAAS